MGSQARGRALRVAVGYAVFAGLWIYCSDSLVSALAPSIAVAGHLSMYKGALFVVVTAWLLYLERHRSEARLAGETAALGASEARQRAMIEALPDLVFVLDADGRVTDYWAPSSELLYAQPESFVGKHLSEVLPQELAELWLAKAQDALRTGEPAECRYTLDIPAGRRQFEARVVPCGGGGGSLAVVRDVTLQHELLEELGRSAKTEALGRMAGDIAHEFNNLLSAVLGYAEFLRDGLDPDDHQRRDDADQILVAARRGAELTSQLLAFSRRQAVHAATFDLVAMVDDLRPVLRRIVPAGAELRFDLATGGGLAAHADAGQIQQALLGLVVNARDALTDGGAVTVSVQPCDGGVRIAVADTGREIDEEAWPHAFEPFWMRNTMGRGSGLGLATIQAVAEQSGGRVDVRRPAVGGNEFGLWLPLSAEPAPVPAEGRPTPVAAEPADDGATLLVVDDEPAVRRLAERVLVRAGYRVKTAGDGAEALAMVEREGLGADGVLTDVVMPGLNGIELVRALRELKPGLKVLFMSGFTQGHLDLGTEEPADLLVKPFSSAELVARVQAMLSREPVSRA